ncbi:MAG TPA: 2-oxoacid:ferredoxin oxidoreductase subunit beta [Patescibacteria group bacterium]|nr:2-oxoacid:ferredoxin oxidoreductase subunit beta [Patescibacteria group bacterium]
MNEGNFPNVETAWCPGCGNHGILTALKGALTTLDKKPHEVLVVSGIGQAAKLPQYISTNGFCGLHGRALPPAAAAKIANKHLTVIVHSGDGDSYGEGGNHFLHNIRRNVDITQFVHNNQIYGLTKGQASPTSDTGYVTDVQPAGSNNIPLNPVLLAIALGCGFVARAFSGDQEHLKAMMIAGIRHKGYALVDILQPCVTFNKRNTYQWYQERVYKLGDDYNPDNKLNAMEKAMEWGDKIPLGILYREEKPDFHDKIAFLQNGKPLVNLVPDLKKIQGFMHDFQ